VASEATQLQVRMWSEHIDKQYFEVWIIVEQYPFEHLKLGSLELSHCTEAG